MSPLSLSYHIYDPLVSDEQRLTSDPPCPYASYIPPDKKLNTLLSLSPPASLIFLLPLSLSFSLPHPLSHPRSALLISTSLTPSPSLSIIHSHPRSAQAVNVECAGGRDDRVGLHRRPPLLAHPPRHRATVERQTTAESQHHGRRYNPPTLYSPPTHTPLHPPHSLPLPFHTAPPTPPSITTNSPCHHH